MSGIAGEPINLAAVDPTADPSYTILITITGMQADWLLNAGTNNGDGSCTVQTNDPSSLSVTTPTEFTGAMVLPVTMTWTNLAGSTGSTVVRDNVEAYAPRRRFSPTAVTCWSSIPAATW